MQQKVRQEPGNEAGFLLRTVYYVTKSWGGSLEQG